MDGGFFKLWMIQRLTIVLSLFCQDDPALVRLILRGNFNIVFDIVSIGEHIMFCNMFLELSFLLDDSV